LLCAEGSDKVNGTEAGAATGDRAIELVASRLSVVVTVCLAATLVAGIEHQLH